jgi:hypothetical protein
MKTQTTQEDQHCEMQQLAQCDTLTIAEYNLLLKYDKNAARKFDPTYKAVQTTDVLTKDGGDFDCVLTGYDNIDTFDCMGLS